jgi:hypothetical protein
MELEQLDAKEQTTMKRLHKHTGTTASALRTLVWGLLTLVLLLPSSQAQQLLDDFDRPNNNTVGNGWTEYESVIPTSISVTDNTLFMRSPGTARDYVSRPVPGTYAAVLSDNACKLEWAFSMRQTRSNPTGFNSGQWGLAMVLAASDPDLLSGEGYAVVLGTPNSTTNRLRLVRYSGGLTADANITNIITTGNFAQQYLDVRVVLEPSTGTWSLFYTDNGTGPFGDPLAASTAAGSAVDNTFTGTTLGYIGSLWNHASGNQARGVFDNIHVPYECQTRLDMVLATDSALETDGTHAIAVAITNPDPNNDTQVSVTLASGDPARVGGFTTQVLTFPAGSSAPQSVVFDILDDGGCAGNETLTFVLHDAVGGTGSPLIGDRDHTELTIVDPQSTARLLVSESFETDGAGSRYQLSAPHGTGPGGAYFLRTDEAGFTTAGALVPGNIHGTHAIGATNLGPLATNSEVTITVPGIDILGMYGVDIELLVAARNESVYDNSTANRDHLLIEVNVDGQGWAEVGAFRSMGAIGVDNKRFAQDTNLDGRGDGTRLSMNLRRYSIPMAISGSSMDLRLRMRTTAVMEEIYFDDLRISGMLCRPVHYSAGSGNSDDPVWSNVRNGAGSVASMDRLATLVVLDGHEISFIGNDMLELTVEAGGSIDLQSNTVTLHGGKLVVDGTLTADQGQLILMGPDAMVVEGGGTLDMYDVTVGRPEGVELRMPMSVRGTLQLLEGVLDNQVNITLVSNANGTGRLGPVPAGADLLGTMTAQRWVPGGATNWRLIGSPVQGATVADWNNDFFTAGFPGSNYPNFYSGSQLWPSIRWYDETLPGPDMNTGLVGVTGNAQPLLTGQGFAAWCGDNLGGTAAFTIDVTGTPHIAQTPMGLPMSWTNSGNPSADGYNLVSNPLPSAIDFSLIQRGADVSNFYWVYDPVSGNNATWNGVVGTNGANGIIQSSQAFWLKANGPAVTTTVDETAKVNDQSGGFFGGLILQDLAMLRLRVDGDLNTFSDEAVVVFQEGEGIAKMAFGHPDAPRIATQGTQDAHYAINMYGVPSGSIAIPVHVQVPAQGNWVLTATGLEQIAGISCLVLEDLVHGTMTTLQEGTTYSFTAEPGAEGARFIIHVSAPLHYASTPASCHGVSDGAVEVTLPEGVATISLLDPFGEVLATTQGSQVNFTGLPAGNYMTRVEGIAGCDALTSNVRIDEPMPMELLVESTPAVCGMSDGHLAVYVLGGTAPHAMAWSNGAVGADMDAAAGVYGLSVTDAHGCVLQRDDLVIEATAVPVASFLVEGELFVQHEAVQFVYTGSMSGDITWDMGDGTVRNELHPVHTYSLPGTYTVTLTTAAGACQEQAVAQVIVQAATGIRSLEASNYRVWSNGTHFVVDHEFSGGQVLYIEVLDATGKLHVQQNYSDGPGRVLVPATALPNGVWFVRLTHDGVQQTQRVPLMR